MNVSYQVGGLSSFVVCLLLKHTPSVCFKKPASERLLRWRLRSSCAAHLSPGARLTFGQTRLFDLVKASATALCEQMMSRRLRSLLPSSW